MHMVSVSFPALRTREFDAMRRLYPDAYGLPVLHEADGAVWFELADGPDGNVYEVMGPAT